jgi:peptidoglycan/LPS O-acetylase OafA/YrhL
MYKSIQTCRGLAAVQVVLFHLGGILAAPKYFGIPIFARAFVFGDAGVEFFFVLSGFIITWVHRRDFGHPSALPGYVSRRLIRIYPTYWIIFSAVFALACLSPVLRAQLPLTPALLIRSLLLLPQDAMKVGGTGAPVLIVAWTLQYELIFYFVAGAAIVNRGLAVAVVVLGLCNVLYCLHGCSFPASFFARDLLFLFALGAGVAWLCDGRLTFRRPRVMVLLAFLGYLVLVGINIWTEIPGYLIDRSIAYGLIFSALILALVQAEDRGWIFGNTPALQLLGDSSYALYLIHFPLLSALSKVAIAIGLSGIAGAAVAFVAMLAASVACAMLFHRWLERPMLRFLASLTPRRSLIAVATQSAN